MYIQLQKGRKRRLLLAIFFSHFHMTLRFSLRSIKESNILIHPLLHSQTPNAGYHEGDAGLAKHGYENVGWAEQGYREDSRVPDPEAAEGPLLLGRPRKALRHLSWGSAEGKGDTEIRANDALWNFKKMSMTNENNCISFENTCGSTSMTKQVHRDS